MKCPSCGTNHRKRQGRTCNCRYRFVFDDPARDKMSDARFLDIVERATRANDHYVTLRQLYAQYCQSVPNRIGKIALAVAVIAALAGIFNLFDDDGGAAGSLPAGRGSSRPNPPLSTLVLQPIDRGNPGSSRTGTRGHESSRISCHSSIGHRALQVRKPRTQ